MINLPRSALVLVKSSWGQKLTRKCLHTCNIIITTINFLYIMYGMIMLSTCYQVNLIVKMWLFYWLCPGYAANTFVFLTLFFKILLRRWQNICKIKHLGILYHFPICIQSIITSCLDGSTCHLIKIRLEKNLPKCHFSPVALLASIM